MFISKLLFSGLRPLKGALILAKTTQNTVNPDVIKFNQILFLDSTKVYTLNFSP